MAMLITSDNPVFGINNPKMQICGRKVITVINTLYYY